MLEPFTSSVVWVFDGFATRVVTVSAQVMVITVLSSVVSWKVTASKVIVLVLNTVVTVVSLSECCRVALDVVRGRSSTAVTVVVLNSVTASAENVPRAFAAPRRLLVAATGAAGVGAMSTPVGAAFLGPPAVCTAGRGNSVMSVRTPPKEAKDCVPMGVYVPVE